MSADLVTWLREQIAEDERECEFNDEPESWCDRAEGVHYDSRRVLAEVTAKREIIEEHQMIGSDLYDDGIVWCQTCSPRTTGPCRTLRLLAAPYASRAGFDPSWLD